MRDKSFFSHFARVTARITGRPITFVLACATIIAWGVSGPIFGFSDTWQLVINTATTIVTFLMVFLIQNTQYRDSEAVQLKLDELIRSIRGAENRFLDLEELTEKDLDDIKEHYLELADHARNKLEKREHAPTHHSHNDEARHRHPVHRKHAGTTDASSGDPS